MKKGSAGKITGIIVLGVVILIIGAIASLWVMFPPEKIKGMVIPQVEKVLGRNVTIGRAGLSLYPVLGITLAEVEIANTKRNGFSQKPFVSLERFLVQISLSSLLRGAPEITRVIIKKPQILLEIDSTGAFNFDDMAMMKKDTTVKGEKKGGGLPMLPVPISMKSFIIEEGAFTYIDQKGAQEFIIGSINQQVRFSIDKQLQDVSTYGDLVLSQVSVKTKEISKPLSNLTITLNHKIAADLVAGNATIEKVRLSFQKLYLNMTGTVHDLNNKPQLDLAITSDSISIKDLLAEVPVELAPVLAKLTAAGTAILDLRVKGILEDGKDLPIEGALALSNVLVKYTSLPKSINDLNAAIQFTSNSLDIKELKMKFGDNPISLRASVVNFQRPLLDLALQARVNLDDLKEMIDLPAGARLSGTIESDIVAKGEADPADPSKLDVKGKSDFKDVAVLWPPLVQPAVINGSFTLSSKAIGENLDVKIGQSSMNMTASVNNYLSLIFADSTRVLPRPVADFRITSPLLNVDEFMPQSAEKKDVPATQETAGHLPLIAPLPGIDMKGTITARKIIYQNIVMNNMNMRMTSINDIADIDIKTGFSGGTISENIHADLRNITNISFRNKLSVSNVEVNELLSSFGNFIEPSTALNKELRNLQNSLSGKINLVSDLTGNGGTADEITNSLRGDVSAKIANGKIANSLILKRLSGVMEKFLSIDDITFRDLSAQLHIANQRVSFESLRLQSNVAGDWDAKGDVGFDASLAVNVNTKLTRSVSERVLAVQGGLKSSGKNLLGGLLGGQLGAAASGLIDQVGIPTDKDGRITLKLALGGTASDPKASFVGFGEGSGAVSQPKQQPSVKEQVTEKVQDVLQQNKEAVQQKLNDERAKLQTEAQKTVQEQKQNLESEAKKQEELLKKKLKKLF